MSFKWRRSWGRRAVRSNTITGVSARGPHTCHEGHPQDHGQGRDVCVLVRRDPVYIELPHVNSRFGGWYDGGKLKNGHVRNTRMRHTFGLRSFGQPWIVFQPAVYHNVEKDVIAGRRRRLNCLEHRWSRFANKATSYSIYPSLFIDMTARRDDGQFWDLGTRQDQKRLDQMQQKHQPDLLIGSAPFTSFRALLHSLKTKEQTEKMQDEEGQHTQVVHQRRTRETVEHGQTFLARTTEACVELMHARDARTAQRWMGTPCARSDVSLVHDCKRPRR